MLKRSCTLLESCLNKVFRQLIKLLAGSKQDTVTIKTPRQPTASSGFSKWASRLDSPKTETVPLKKWPWYARKPLETIQFKYEDRKGSYSIRTVDVFASTYSYFTGYCYQRKASRTFKIDRVNGLVTVIQTGELMNPHLWASALYTHPKNNNEVDMGDF